VQRLRCGALPLSLRPRHPHHSHPRAPTLSTRRHLANTTERPVRGGDAALFEITLTVLFSYRRKMVDRFMRPIRFRLLSSHLGKL